MALLLALALVCPAFCMPAWAAQPLADRLAAMLAADEPADAAALLDSVKAELLDGDTAETADDIAQEWSTGTLVLERGGVYRLSENVETATTLKVAAPEHAAIVIDLAGCSVAGTGGLSTLIQVTDESKGTVAVVDSSLWLAERDHDPDTLVPASTLSLRLDGAADSAQIISVAKLSGLKPDEKRTAPALILSNIGLDLSYGERGSAKSAACLAVEDGPVVLADAFAARAAGDACGIASSTEDAFELLPGFNPDGTLTAELTGSKAAVLAHAAKGWDAEKAKALAFANAGAAGGSYAFDGGALFTLQTPAAAEALQEQGGTDAGASSTGASRSMSAMALEGTDIAAAWGKLGTDKVFTVSEGGSYYLGSDIKTSARLYINAPGEDVVLDFGGHTLTVDDTSSTGMGLAIGSAASVTLKGDAERKSTLFMNSSYIYYGIMCNQADELKVEGLTVKVRSNDDSLSLKYLKSYGIYMNKGALTVDNSAVTVDLSNQANTATSGNSSVENGPKAVLIEPGAGAASLKGSTFTVLNSNVVTVRDDSSLLNTGFAQGIWADGTAGVKVEDCSFDVSSPLGTAIGLYGRSLALSGSNSITTHAALYSTSLYAPSTGAIHLGGTLSTSFDAAPAKHEVDLYSAASGGFVFDEGFAATRLSAWTGTDEASACGDGSVIASFAAAMGASARDALASKVVNAKGADAACDVARDDDTLRFELAESRAVAVVTHVGEDTPYASAADAIAAAKSGDIVRLLADCGQIKVAKGAAGETFAIDLAGHGAASIVAASPAGITVFSSQAAGAVVSCDAATFAAVTHSGTGHLALEGITVRASSSNSKLTGVYVSGSGTLSLDGVDIHAVAGVSEACCIRLDGSAGNLSVANSSLSATAAATGVAAYGIVSSSTKNALSIEASPITVAGTTAYIRGIEHRSTLELSGKPGTTSIAVQASGASTSAYGVNVPTSAASTTLTDCSIEAVSSAATQLWCLGMGSATSSNAPDWTLKGATSLSSSNNTEVAANAGKLSFGADFTNSGDVIHLNTRNLAGDSFGTVAEGAAVDAGELVPAADSDYDGYSAALAAGTGLVWLHTPVARIGETLFSSLDGAVSAAQAGDVIQVVDDFTLSKAVKISREITIDLAGHHATIAAGAKGSGGSNKAGGALVYNAAGTFAVVDSVGGGKIDISVGSPTETSNTAANGYQGIAVTGGGTLSMSGVEVGVAYAGSCPAATKPLMNLYGVYLKDGAAKLSDGATLKVVGAPEDGSFGATRAYGIYAAASDASIAVDESSRVEVVSNAANTVLSYMDYPGVGSSSGAQSSSNAYLMEITPEEGSELYEMVQETFRTKASFDSAIDQKGYVYGTQIYYVTSQALDNKVSIWAYSDPVTGEDVGKADSIKATHIYIRSDYARPNYAYGIASADSFAGTATIAGAVSAQTAAGAAYGIYENEAGAWSVDEDKAVATATAATYKSAATSKMDLASIIDFDDKSLKDIKYPKNSGFYLVSEVKSVADSVHKPGGGLRHLRRLLFDRAARARRRRCHGELRRLRPHQDL